LPPVILIALVAIVFTAVWLGIFDFLNDAIWGGDAVTDRRWLIPVGAVFFSLLVGLAQKYLHAPTLIHSEGGEPGEGEGQATGYRTFPGALVSSWLSLISGASVGPEGPLGVLVKDISAWMRDRLKIRADEAEGVDVAALASAYNGIVGSPVFAAVLATEIYAGVRASIRFLGWNLLAGAIGYLFFALLGLPSFYSAIPFEPIEDVTLEYVLWALGLGLIGALIALVLGASLRVFGSLLDRLFKDGVVVRTVGAGVVIGAVCFAIPELQFSGESSIHAIIDDPERYGVAMLLVMAVLKVLLLALAFKGGFMGGPIFPVLFASTMIALALSLTFPSLPRSMFVECIEAAAVALVLRAPLTAILLVGLVGTTDENEVALVVVSVVSAMLVGGFVQRRVAQRAATNAAPATTKA
jgi:H+/Cl- antiporter ClcA